MKYNIFIIPLITGYFILISSKLLKYNLQRQSKSRLLFESVFISILIIAVGFIIRSFLSDNFIQILLEKLKVFDFQKPLYFWTFIFASICCVIINQVFNIIINFIYKKDDPILWAVNKNGDEVEKLVTQSARKGNIIQLTLKNDKVYIGFSESIPIPQKTNYLTISPLLSGYRDKETKRMVLTTDYFGVVRTFMEEIEEHEEVTLKTDVIIKQDEILTANVFDLDVYERFNS